LIELRADLAIKLADRPTPAQRFGFVKLSRLCITNRQQLDVM
jgi:hypothetical protein